MINKFYALITVFALGLSVVGGASANAAIDAKKSASQTAQLAALLPESDAVATLDARRLVGEALPQILSGDTALLNEIVGKIDEVKTKTGFDLRQFEQIAVGVSSRKTGAQAIDLQPVVLARGTFNANALIALGKIAANGKFREEKIGDRSIYVFSPKQLMQNSKFRTAPLPQQKSSPADSSAAPSSAPTRTLTVFERAVERMLDNLSREVAVAAYDGNTLAIGSLARVRETFGARRISADALNLVSRRPNAVAAVGLKLPDGVSDLIPSIGNDEIGQTIDSIRFLAGSFDVNDGAASISIAAKTAQPAQAQNLFEQLEGLRMLGKMFVGGNKGADKEVYNRMLENVKIERAASEVTLDLQVPQTDINILLSKKK